MRIVTDGADWTVRAQWFGEDRVVFRGDIFACLAFVRDAE